MILDYIIGLVVFLMSFVFLLLTIALTTLLERKVMGSVQRRRGPAIAGLLGFLQPIADGLKLFLKEIIIPTSSNTFLFIFAPVFTLFSSILLWLVIPFGKSVVLLDFSYSMLFLLAVSSLAVYGIIFSGWASNSKYAFLGGLRSTAQMISYEVTISFIWLIISLLGNSLNLAEIVKKQEETVWFIFPLFPVWIIFFIIILAETNRAPFDLPEAEAELVAGYNVEYSSIAFALFFLGEYANMALMSSISTLFFFGGWLCPFNIIEGGFFSFGLKVSLHLIFFIWVRATFPRYRYDQLMKLSRKKLMPISIVFLLLVVFLLFQIRSNLCNILFFLKILFLWVIFSILLYIILSYIYLFILVYFKIKYKFRFKWTIINYIYFRYMGGGIYYVLFPLEFNKHDKEPLDILFLEALHLWNIPRNWHKII